MTHFDNIKPLSTKTYDVYALVNGEQYLCTSYNTPSTDHPIWATTDALIATKFDDIESAEAFLNNNKSCHYLPEDVVGQALAKFLSGCKIKHLQLVTKLYDADIPKVR